MRRGLLGGTFDPPHLAHLRAGEAAYRQLGLDTVTFMPAGTPWQKTGRVVSDAEHRWRMTVLATDAIEYFEADAREVRRHGWTYTVDTLASFPDGDEIVLILGADAAMRIRTWNRWRDVVARVSLAVVPRPGTDGGDVAHATGGQHIWLDTAKLNVSGTMIRALAARGRSFRFLVPDPVWEYAVEHRLYAETAAAKHRGR